MKRDELETNRLLQEMLLIHVPKEYLDYFELKSVNNKTDCWELVLEEKQGMVPPALLGKDSVLDGFCNAISILTHSFSLKKIFLIVRRRRWKERGSKKHYSNQYDLYNKGAKLTREFAAFLKEIDRN